MRSSSTPSGHGAPVRRRSLRRGAGLAAVLLTTLVLSSCASDAELDTFKPRGETARQIDDLITPVFLVAGIVLLIIAVIAWLIRSITGSRR